MSSILDLVRAPPGATSPQLRKLGLKGTVIGAVIFVPGLLWFIFARGWAVETFGSGAVDGVRTGRLLALVIGSPVTLGYCLLMIGLSRLLFGAASQSTSALASLGRILFGLVVTMGMIFLAVVILRP